MNEETEIQAIPKLLTDESTKYKGPGWQLRTAREAAQIGIGDVARQLRLSVDMIASIERDDYTHMAGLTFIRGYLRSYARLLNLPGDDILIAFDRLGIPEKVPQIPLNIYGAKQTSINDSTIRSIGYAVFAGLVILAAVWWHSQSSNNTAKSTPAASTQQTPNAAAAPAQSQTAVPATNQAEGQATATKPATDPTKTQEPVAPASKQPVTKDTQERVVNDSGIAEEVKPKLKMKARRRAIVDEEATGSAARTRSSEPSSVDGESD